MIAWSCNDCDVIYFCHVTSRDSVDKDIRTAFPSQVTPPSTLTRLPSGRRIRTRWSKTQRQLLPIAQHCTEITINLMDMLATRSYKYHWTHKIWVSWWDYFLVLFTTHIQYPWLHCHCVENLYCFFVYAIHSFHFWNIKQELHPTFVYLHNDNQRSPR